MNLFGFEYTIFGASDHWMRRSWYWIKETGDSSTATDGMDESMYKSSEEGGDEAVVAVGGEEAGSGEGRTECAEAVGELGVGWFLEVSGKGDMVTIFGREGVRFERGRRFGD